MRYPSLNKRHITIEPQARRCMEHLGITAAEVILTMQEWDSCDVVATDPLTANTLAAYPETADEIPAFYEVERNFPEHHLTLFKPQIALSGRPLNSPARRANGLPKGI